MRVAMHRRAVAVHSVWSLCVCVCVAVQTTVLSVDADSFAVPPAVTNSSDREHYDAWLKKWMNKMINKERERDRG